MNEKQIGSKTGPIIVILTLLVAGGWMLKLDLKTSETQKMIQEQQAMIFAFETLPRQPPANASGQLYFNRPWLQTATDSLGIAVKITGQTVDTVYNMTDSTYKVELNTVVEEDTLWDFR